MTTPGELYQAGRLDEAIELSLALVKKKPADSALRFQLAELSCIAGDLERADRQLDTIANQDAKAVLSASLFRQLVRAEMSRRECFLEGRVPEFIGTPTRQAERHLRALAALRADDPGDASAILSDTQDDPAEASSGWIVNEQPVETIRDLDDLLAPVLEVHTSTGKYFWINWNQIISMIVHPPKRSIDLLWRQATLTIENGPDGEVYLPAIYIDPMGVDLSGGTSSGSDFRLGRSTDWIQVSDSLYRGRGQKTLLIGEDDLPLMELQTIERRE